MVRSKSGKYMSRPCLSALGLPVFLLVNRSGPMRIGVPVLSRKTTVFPVLAPKRRRKSSTAACWELADWILGGSAPVQGRGGGIGRRSAPPLAAPANEAGRPAPPSGGGVSARRRSLPGFTSHPGSIPLGTCSTWPVRVLSHFTVGMRGAVVLAGIRIVVLGPARRHAESRPRLNPNPM